MRSHASVATVTNKHRFGLSSVAANPILRFRPARSRTLISYFSDESVAAPFKPPIHASVLHSATDPEVGDTLALLPPNHQVW